MAKVKNARGVLLVLKVATADSPNDFEAKCSINAARGIKITSPTNEFPDIDCDNPDAVAWVLREKSSLSATVNGAGILNTPDVQDFYDWAVDTNSHNCQVIVDVAALDGGVIFEGFFHLTSFEITGDRGAKQQCAIQLDSDGEVTCVPNT